MTKPASRYLPGMTRRDLLRSLGFAGAASALAGPAARWATTTSGARDLVSLAAATAPAGSDIGAIDHIVFLMMENRSYDHYFGTYPKGAASTTIPRIPWACSRRIIRAARH